jgi:hypothetical protein
LAAARNRAVFSTSPLVHQGAAAEHRDLPLQAKVLVLLGDAEGLCAEEEHEDGVHVSPDLGEIGGEVLGVQGDPESLDDLPAVLLEGPLEAAGHLPPEGIVRSEHRDSLVAQGLGRVLAEGVGVLAAGPG